VCLCVCVLIILFSVNFLHESGDDAATEVTGAGHNKLVYLMVCSTKMRLEMGRDEKRRAINSIHQKRDSQEFSKHLKVRTLLLGHQATERTVDLCFLMILLTHQLLLGSKLQMGTHFIPLVTANLLPD
jgi:hypothetical protein